MVRQRAWWRRQAAAEKGVEGGEVWCSGGWAMRGGGGWQLGVDGRVWGREGEERQRGSKDGLVEGGVVVAKLAVTARATVVMVGRR